MKLGIQGPQRAATLVASLLALVGAAVHATGGDDDAPGAVRNEVAWKTTIATADEPGERMAISGVILDRHGKPVAGVRVDLHHTDIHGHYGENSRGSFDPRLKSSLVTDASGRYEYDTIKPGPYPSGGTPAHVHYTLSTESGGQQTFEIFFEGDEFLSSRTRALARKGEVCSIVELERDDAGVLRAHCDIVYRK